MKVVAGSSSRRLASEVAKLLGSPLADATTKQFPDGEIYVRVADDLRGEDVVLVSTTYPNDKLVETLLLEEAAHGQGAARITTVIPYFAYSRQDRAFEGGEVVSAQAIAELLEAKTDRVLTVDPHKEHILGFFGVEARGASAVPELAEAFRARGIDTVLAPDKGALDRAEEAGRLLGCDVDHLEKTRLSGDTVVMKPKRLDVAGKRVGILDDIISTGGTIAKAATELKSQGARAVVAACTHGLLLGGADARMREAGVDEVLATDTIEGPASKVSAAPAVVRALRGWPEGPRRGRARGR